MKKIAVAAFAFGVCALGAKPPVVVNNLNGILIDGPFNRHEVTVEIGEIEDCEVSQLTSLVIYKCPISPSTVSVKGTGKDAGRSFTVTAKKLRVMYYGEDNHVHEYTLIGEYSELSPGGVLLHSPVTVELKRSMKKPTDVQGRVFLSRYDQTFAFEAIPID